MIHMSNINGKRKICYVKKGESIPENWVYEKAENFSKGFMIVGAITGRGVLPLIRVPPKAKINSEYYIKYVLKRLLEKELQKLCPGELNKVFVHHDKASSHTSIKTSEYAADLKARTGISIIDNSLIPVKSPDASPLDFFGFGYLKQQLFLRRARILDDLWKTCRQEWSKISLEMVRNVFDSWKRRLHTISRNGRQHIEQTKQIHKRRILI